MLKPTNDWIVTKPLPKKEKVTDMGLFLLNQEEPLKLVKIISFGPAANKNSILKAGDIVMVPTKTGISVEYKEETFEMAKEQNFLGVME